MLQASFVAHAPRDDFANSSRDITKSNLADDVVLQRACCAHSVALSCYVFLIIVIIFFFGKQQNDDEKDGTPRTA